MTTREATSHLEEALARWEEQTLKPTLARLPERAAAFTTTSLRPIQRLYTPLDIQHLDFERDIGFPGEYPFTRGIHPTMYRGKLWTMRQFAGFGTAFDTNKRFKYLLEQGQTGLSVAFDLPTLMGLDSDHPLAEGEVGKCGVAVSSLEDMEVLFDGIPLEEVTTSMTINAPAAVIFAMYLVVAEKQGADWKKISGKIQNDILKEYIAQKEWIYPPRPSMRLIVDTIAFCTREVPRWHPISISGYHIREAGSTALQELAFTLRDGIEYVEWCVQAGASSRWLVASLVRGDREVPRGAQSLGARHARAIRRARSALLDVSVPHADGRMQSDGAAAVQQRRAHDDSSPGGGARGDAEPAHECSR
jgi:methylmalonyl-CoA mutase N-terminal domain/subunit